MLGTGSALRQCGRNRTGAFEQIVRLGEESDPGIAKVVAGAALTGFCDGHLGAEVGRNTVTVHFEVSRQGRRYDGECAGCDTDSRGREIANDRADRYCFGGGDVESGSRPGRCLSRYFPGIGVGSEALIEFVCTPRSSDELDGTKPSTCRWVEDSSVGVAEQSPCK